MASEEKIINKIIPIETIVEIAGYLEDQKEEYKRLFENDKNKNINLSYREQVYQYKGDNVKVQYTLKFKDGKEIEEEDYICSNIWPMVYICSNRKYIWTSYYDGII